MAEMLAILVAATKVLELVLDERQQKGVQAFCDKLAYFLIGFDITQHYRKLTKPAVRLPIVFGFVIAVGALNAYLVFIEDPQLAVTAGGHRLFVSANFLVGLALIVFLANKALVAISLSTHGGRYLMWSSVLWVVVFTVAANIAPENAAIREGLGAWYGTWQMLLFIGTILLWVGWFIVILKAVQLTLRACLWFFGKIMWRIATHTKGAWTAITLILSAVITVGSEIARRQ